MTAVDSPTGWDEPAAELERQAAEHTDPPARRTAAARAARRLPPHDLDLEADLLGLMLHSLEACDTILNTGLEPEDFYRPAHQAIYAAICDVIAAGDTPEPRTIALQLPAGILNDLGGPGELVLLLSRAPAKGNAGTYARRLHRLARARHLQAAGAAIANIAGQGDLEAALDLLGRTVTASHTHDTDTTWHPVDLTNVITGDGPPPPTMLARDDGHCLLYAGKVHAFNAESESGKSWLALHACAEQIAAQEHVVYLDFEDDAADIVARLQALGTHPGDIVERFHYVRPDDPIDTIAIAALERLLTDHQPTLAIIDGVTEVMVQNGWSITDNDDTARFLLALPRRIARHGAAVVLIDHVTKDKEGRGRYGIGAQHKLAGINGAAYQLEVTKPFGRGRTGVARITTTKDRPGHVRGNAFEGRFVAELTLHALNNTGDVTIQLTARAGESTEPALRPTALMERVSRHIEELNAAGIEPNKNGIVADVKGKRTFILDAIRLLIAEGHITLAPGPNRSTLHRVTTPYRAADDPRSDAYQPADTDQPEDLEEF